MITLYAGGPQFGLPEVSPYCTKTEVHLRMAGLPYRKVPAHPGQSPKGQLPFMDDGGEVVADSTFIRLHLERRYGIDFDEHLTARQRAEAWAIERMIENHLGWVGAWHRFMDEENFARGPAHWFDGVPEAERAGYVTRLKENVRDRLLAVGIGRHAPDEIVMLGKRSLDALAVVIGDGPYLMGGKPCGADATTFAMLVSVMNPFFDGPLRDLAAADRRLTAYVDRMMREFYPDHGWTL
ncbi:glutathione S-transferase family protein [Rhizobium sp. TRM95111]|uniref:glutathione S-transferase family protein n=1 Tax=Rhizobium alarense TaxID=2846851 RepID=UPI001F293DEB|nr:glutathione S-transferase family protein [Rhizobium alarense]MCF3643263.1 glutathione S-transferase family protein [Rhizobium alarense]